MRKHSKTVFVLAAATLLATLAEGCLEEKVIEIVVKSETSTAFANNSKSQQWVESVSLDYGAEVDRILRDNGYTRAAIKTAKVAAASYGATSLSNSHDWTVSGSLDIRRIDAPSDTVNLVSYSQQSVQDALGQRIGAPLETAGVTLLNDALSAFIGGADPVLEFSLNNGAVSPPPSASDPIVFEWRAWITLHVIVEETVDVPDPF